VLSGLRYWFQDNDRGAFAVGAPNETVRELTGKEAEDFETIARRHAALPASRQSFGARSTTPIGGRATAPRAQWWCAVR
jgi:hypothetical protein